MNVYIISHSRNGYESSDRHSDGNTTPVVATNFGHAVSLYEDRFSGKDEDFSDMRVRCIGEAILGVAPVGQ